MAGNEHFEDSIGRWLEETAPNRLPQRVLTATFERTRRSRQQLGWRAVLRRPQMPRLIPALGGAAVVVMAAVLALNVIPLFGPGGPPTPSPSATASPGRPAGIFADVGGWIAFSYRGGIWARDPARLNDRDSWVQLSSEGGTPKAWSPNGSKLLVLGDVSDIEHPDQMILIVLNADGTETRLAHAGSGSGADFTPDGSQVIYGDGDNIYVIDVAGGTPELLLAGDPPLWTLSPDGTHIAYIDWGHGDGGHSVRVMNSDGTGVRVVVDDSMNMGAGHIRDFRLNWSPDGQQLEFANTQGRFVAGLDGSGLRRVSRDELEVPFLGGVLLSQR